MRSSTRVTSVLRSRFRFALAQQQAHLEAEELLEYETALRRRPIGVEGVERRADRGEVHLLEGRPAVRKPEARPDTGRQRIVEVRREPQQRVRDQPPLHLRRDRSRALVHGNDPARVQRIGFRVGRVGLDQLEVGVGELQAGVGIPLQRAVEHDVIARVELILQERGVEPRDADRAARVADERLEDPEAGPPRRAEPALHDLTADRDGLPFLHGSHGPQVAAVLVTQGKPVEEVFDRVQAGTRKICRFARTHTLQVLQRRLEYLAGWGHA